MHKHRLVERPLSDVIGLDPASVHEEACRWEHVISDHVEEKLAELLGNPSTSPSGDPILGVGDDEVEVVPLAATRDRERGDVTLQSISESLQGDVQVIRLLHEHGMHAGQTVAIKQLDANVVLERDGERIELEPDAARLVYVVASP